MKLGRNEEAWLILANGYRIFLRLRGAQLMLSWPTV